MSTGRLLVLVAIALSLAVHNGYSGPSAEPNAPASQPVVSDRHVCICNQISAGGVGWCARHSRGFAYGHVIRTWPLMRLLLPTDLDPDGGPACPACPGRQPGTDEQRTGDGQARTWPAFPPEGPGAVGMANALLKCGAHSGYVITGVPGYCELCQHFHVNDRTYRSWVAAALEVGQPLPGLAEGTSQTTDAGASRATKPPSPENPPSASPDEAGEDPGAATAGNAGTPAPRCAFCREAFANGAKWTSDGFPAQPFCEVCGAGVVAGRVFTGHDAYELAKAADAGLAYGRLHRCERCGTSVLTGGRCNVCSNCRKCHSAWADEDWGDD